jgi:hypothetical protein
MLQAGATAILRLPDNHEAARLVTTKPKMLHYMREPAKQIKGVGRSAAKYWNEHPQEEEQQQNNIILKNPSSTCYLL